jgi:phosphate transport system permease protein
VNSELKPRAASVLGREEGIPWVWLTGGALVTVLLMIISLLGYIFSQGAIALWPRDILLIPVAGVGAPSPVLPTDGGSPSDWVVGVFHRATESSGSSVKGQAASGASADTEPASIMIYQANQEFSTDEFRYVTESSLRNAVYPKNFWYVERWEWGPFIGQVKSLGIVRPEGATESFSLSDPDQLHAALALAAKRREGWLRFEADEITPLNHELEDIRIELKAYARLEQQGQPLDETDVQHWKRVKERAQELGQRFEEVGAQLQKLRDEDNAYTVTLVNLQGEEKTLSLSAITRAFQPNRLHFFEKFAVYFDRVWEFLTEKPREANTLGGVFPAVFGTVVMTLLMTIAVLPIGVMAAIYIREIASQGVVVSVVRIAVGNLAGVPSIVYGIFGLGFFCYTLGGSIDEVFFRDRLPSPTFGTGGILWASLTLALLTLPVVIVSTEEALQAVPRSLREASYGCGATRLQTLLRIVIPKALPGIMTGLILAMARGMGEVAPLLVTGVVKLAPELPLDGYFPFVHLERSFMHLGFHIYDVGFQSRSAEISRSMVFASTALLLGLVFALNLVAIRVRSQLRKRFEGRGAF